MAQLTIYLDDALLEDVRKRAKESGKSVSAVVAEAVRNAAKRPERELLTEEFWNAVGVHPDFPLAEEIRARDVPDLPRVPIE